MSDPTPSHAHTTPAGRPIAQVLEDVLRRRAAGLAVPDEELIAAHPELMPELGEKLRALRQVEEAGRRAAGAAVGPDGAAATLSLPAEAATRRSADAPSPLSDSFVGYQLLREIHRGGQGVVYQAIQKSTQRKVAIKVMKEGPFAGPGDRARFEREVQILGQLQHPNIVTVHDSGSAAGVFYFVMDYISGQPLDLHMAGKKWSIADTLRLFQKICEAVNAAHLKGVIHRDLKPGNIRIDNDGEPHVLDFGLAKVVHGADEAALMTMTGQFMGSLPWASPEQAEAKPGKIDIRTDVYSLGVILYQMLTGKFPYDVIGNMRDVLDRIMKAEPAKPSTVRKQINDEVETIVLKCLSKERERRYQTAGELARDVGHYLKGEPIEAKRDSFGYMLQKQLSRYRIPVAVGALFVVVLLVFGVVMSIQARRNYLLAESERQAKDSAVTYATEARDARQQAEAERLRADEQRDAALAAKSLAEKQQNQAEWQAYVANITAADASLQNREPQTVQRRLAACPELLRGWEWRFIGAEADQSLQTVNGPARILYGATGDQTTSVLGLSQSGCLRCDSAAGTIEVDQSPEQLRNDGSRMLLGVTASGDRCITVQRRRGGDSGVSSVLELRGSIARTVIAHWDIPGNGPRIAAISPDGRCVALVAEGADVKPTIELFQTDDLVKLRSLDPAKGRGDTILALCFSPDSQRLAASLGRTVAIWDTPSGELMTILSGFSEEVSCVTFTPDGARVVAGARDGVVTVHELPAGRLVRTFDRIPARITAVASSPDGHIIASAAQDTLVRLLDAGSGKMLAEYRGHQSAPQWLAFTPDSALLLSGELTRTVKVWDANIAGPTHALDLSGGMLRAIAFDARDGYLAVASFHAYAALQVDLPMLRVSELKTKHQTFVNSVAFSADGALLASGDELGNVLVRHLVTGRVNPFQRVERRDSGQRQAREDAALNDALGSVASLVFVPKSTRLAALDYHGTVTMWDSATGDELVRKQNAAWKLGLLSAMPDGVHLLVSSNQQLYTLDSQTCEPVANSAVPLPAAALAVSPDGSRVAVGYASYGNDQSVCVVSGHDPIGNSVIWSAAGHAGPVESLAFSPDGTRLVSGSSDQTVKVWDASSGEELLTLRGHRGDVTGVAFSRDGTRIASCSYDGTVRIWDAVPYRERRHECRDVAAVEAAARELVIRQLREPPTFDDALAQLSDDSSIAEPVRSTATRLAYEVFAEQVNAAIKRAYADAILTDDAVAQLQNDMSLPACVRLKAIELVRAQTDIPERLNARAWELVRVPTRAAAEYAWALRAAERAAAADQANGLILNTLGAAQYRVGEYERALETLSRSDDLNRKALFSASDGAPADVAFIAMSLHKLGRAEEAQAALERLRKLARHESWSNDVESQAFLAEAEVLITGTPTSQPATGPSSSAPRTAGEAHDG